MVDRETTGRVYLPTLFSGHLLLCESDQMHLNLPVSFGLVVDVGIFFLSVCEIDIAFYNIHVTPPTEHSQIHSGKKRNFLF